MEMPMRFKFKFTFLAFSSSMLFSATPPIASTVPKPTPTITVAALPAAAGITRARRQSMPDIHQDSKHGMEHQKSAPASNPIPIRPNIPRAQSMTERASHSWSSSAHSQYKATIYKSPQISPFASPLNSKSPSPINVPVLGSRESAKEKNISLLVSELGRAVNRKNGISPKNKADLELIRSLLQQALDEVEKLKAIRQEKDDAKN
jgi:hypothetical protein